MFGFSNGRKRPLVLHVDDDPAIREIIALTLENLGLDVLSAPDGPTGLNLARDKRPDLILLDIRMPGMDGFDTCHYLKTDPKTKATPVIMLTAMGQGKDVEKAIANGADAYIQKPIDFDKLQDKISTFVKITPPPRR